MMHTDIDVDEGLLDIMEKSYLYTSEHEVVAWIRGQRRTIKVTKTIPMSKTSVVKVRKANCT